MKAWALVRGQMFSTVPNDTDGLKFEGWHVNGMAMVSAVPDTSGYGRGFMSGITKATTVYTFTLTDTKEK